MNDIIALNEFKRLKEELLAKKRNKHLESRLNYIEKNIKILNVIYKNLKLDFIDDSDMCEGSKWGVYTLRVVEGNATEGHDYYDIIDDFKRENDNQYEIPKEVCDELDLLLADEKFIKKEVKK